MVSSARSLLGGVHYEWNDLVRAETVLTEVGPASGAADVYPLACVLEASVRPGEADALIESALRAYSEPGDVAGLALARATEALVALWRGRLEPALLWATGARPERIRPWASGSLPCLICGQILIADPSLAHLDRARELLDLLDRTADATNDRRLRIRVLAQRALWLEAAGLGEDALKTLREALDLAEPGGFTRLFLDLGPALKSLLARLPDDGMYVERIRRGFDAESE